MQDFSVYRHCVFLCFCGITFGQKKSEFTVRANVMLMDCSVNATAGVFTNEDSDLMLGGMWVYKNAEDNKSLRWYYSWQPGVAFRTRGESNVFLGISLGPTFGLHAGLTF